MLAKTIYGVEYNPNPIDDNNNGIGWVIVVIVVITLIALGWTIYSNFRDRQEVDAVLEMEAPETPVKPVEKIESVLPAPKPIVTQTNKRPQNLRVLLQRLEEAQKLRDLELEVSTLEQIRALPGSPAADLDDHLARRLGQLNIKRLFEKKCRIWVKEIEVRPGQSASRMAAENGSTLASFSRLNGDKVDKVFAGKKMYVLDHPRFQLVIHRRLRTADLMLNGKYFKRYDLKSTERAKEGAFELSLPIRAFWQTVGIELNAGDAAELELLLPKGSPVLVSEL